MNSDLIKQVEWKDLTRLSAKEMCMENSITLPWLAASLWLSYAGYYIWVLPCATFFFLTGLRQVHNGFHRALGTGSLLTWICLYTNSIWMMASIHAVQYNHLQHHKYCLGEKDYEGRSARMKGWQAILYGPVHIFMIHKVAL